MKKDDNEVAKELGIGGTILIGMLFLFPLIVFAIPFLILFRLLKGKKVSLLITILALFIFGFTLIFDYKAYFAIYGILPFEMSWISNLIGRELIFTNVSWVLYASGGIVTGYTWSLVTDYIRSKKVHSKEDKRDKFKASDNFQKVYENRFKINLKMQQRWRKEIQSGKTDKLLLGISEAGKPYFIDFKEINQHMFTPATTGGGKTVLLLNFIEYALIKDYPLIFIDGKGSLESVEDVRSLCERYGKKMKLFSDSENLTYNPIKHGNATVITDKLQALVETESDYYVKVNEVLVQTLIQFIDEYKLKRDLWTFAKYLDPAEIKRLLNSDTETIAIEEEQEEETEKEYGSFLDTDETASSTATKKKKKTVTKEVRSERAARFYQRFFENWESTDEGELYLFANAAVVRLAISSLLGVASGKCGFTTLRISKYKKPKFLAK